MRRRGATESHLLNPALSRTALLSTISRLASSLDHAWPAPLPAAGLDVPVVLRVRVGGMSRWEHRSIPDQYMFAIAPLLIYIGGGVRGRFWMQEQRVGVGRVACRDRTSRAV